MGGGGVSVLCVGNFLIFLVCLFGFFWGGRVEEVLDLVYDRKLTTLHIHKGISYFATCRIG